MKATFTRLKNGEWGIRTEGVKPVEGGIVAVSKFDGTCEQKRIARILTSHVHPTKLGVVCICTIHPDSKGKGK